MSEKNRNKNKRRWLSVFAVIIIVLLAFLICEAYKRQANTEVNGVTENNQSCSTDESPRDDEWTLVLVNRNNPLRGENEDIELTELSNGEKVDSRIYPELQKMFDDMRADGVYPIVVSGYRTQKEQKQIYDNKIAEYVKKGYSRKKAKAEAEKWVAVPGTSEHQLGLGVDINADGVHSYGYEVYNWLAENAHRYGFIHRYPKDKVKITGISNEPWHYRYVGVKAAGEIYKQGVCLEEYLENAAK